MKKKTIFLLCSLVAGSIIVGCGIDAEMDTEKKQIGIESVLDEESASVALGREGSSEVIAKVKLPISGMVSGNRIDASGSSHYSDGGTVESIADKNNVLFSDVMVDCNGPLISAGVITGVPYENIIDTYKEQDGCFVTEINGNTIVSDLEADGYSDCVLTLYTYLGDDQVLTISCETEGETITNESDFENIAKKMANMIEKEEKAG